MLNFTPIDESHAERLGKYYADCPYRISGYSVLQKLMWGDILRAEYAVSHGCLIVRSRMFGKYAFDFPFAVEADADLDGALSDMASFCMAEYIPFLFANVPHDCVTELFRRYPSLETRTYRYFNDYLYAASDLANFSGKPYAGQRNHVKKFLTKYPDAVFRALTADDMPLLSVFRREFGAAFSKSSDEARDELSRTWQMLSFVGSPLFRCGGYILDGRLISFSLAERCGDTLITHIEKAFPEFEGVYPATVKAFAALFAGDVTYINREEDGGDRGLRTSKMQYHPAMLLEKQFVAVRSPLHLVDEVPTLTTERLTLDAISEADIPSYNRLCLDEERNRYWGYDYKANCEKPDERYFFLDQKNDFENRVAMNFAIRRDGVFIGEAILHHFDFRGGCEVGLRLLPEFGKRGYAKEAFAAVCDYALYGIGLDEVVGKCHRDNEASKRMLASAMRPVGEEGEYLIFRRTV